MSIILSKNQPCGCVVCDCMDDEKCHGCGAKRCNSIANCVLTGDMRHASWEEDGALSELDQLKAENKAQLAELTAISDALGTREGHSSVRHIEALKAEVKLLTEALEAIVKHQLIVGGSLATYSATVKIAEKALKGE